MAIDSEYWITLDEKNKVLTLTSEHKGNIPIDLSSLERRCFSYVEPRWTRFMLPEEYGFAFRYGEKSVQLNNSSQEAYLYFYVPIARNGRKINEQEREKIRENIDQVVKAISKKIASSNKGTRVASLILTAPPKWMLDELLEED